MTPKAFFIFLGIASALWFIARIRETGGTFFRDPIRDFRAQSRFDQVFIAIFLIACCVSGGSKRKVPAGAPDPVPAAVTSAVPLEPLEPLNDRTGAPRAGALTPAQYAAGFARISAATNPAAWRTAPSNAVVHAPWTVYGVAEDTFWLQTNGWSFTLGTNQIDGLHVSSSGLVSFQNPLSTPSPSSVPANASLLAPLHGSLGTVPPQGRFWHAPTPSGGLLLTWENLYAGRDTNCPVSFQSELFGNGDFRFRYKIPAGSALRSPGHAFTNLFIGARHNGGGEAYALNDPSALTNGLELCWRAFGLLDPAIDDHDGDGLSTHDELFIHGTDPRRADTDLDGVDDGAEMTLGTDPLDPDTDGDLAADSIDPDPLSPGDPGAILNCCSNTWLFHMHHALPTNGTCEASGFPWDDSLFAVTVTLDAPVADPGAVLWIGEIPLVMRDPGSWTLWLDKAATQTVWLCARHGVEVDYTVSSDVPGFFIQQPPPAPPPPPLSHAVSREGTVAAPFFTVEPAAACFHGEPFTFRATGCAAGLSGQYAWSYGGTTVVTNVPEFTVWPDIDGLPTEVSVAFMPDGLDAGAPARAGTGTLSSLRSEWPATRCSSCGYCQRHVTTNSLTRWWCDLTGKPADEGRCPAAGRGYIPPANGTNTFFTLPVPRRPAAWPDCWATLSPWPSGHGGQGTPPNDPDDCGHGPGCSHCQWAVDHWHRRQETGGTIFDHSGCCSCPEHNPHSGGGGGQGSGPVVYEGAAGLAAAFRSFDGGGAVPLAPGPLPDSPGVVTVTGLTPSAAPYDRSVRFSRFDPHLPMTFYETDRFTVLSLDLQPDVDLDGAAGPGDDAALAADWDRTWLIPAGTNAFPLKVFNDAALPGAYTLALDGPSNIVARYGGVTVRGGESNAVAFPPGSTLETVLVQAEGPGEAVLTLSFQGTGAASGISCEALLKMTAVAVTLEPVTTENSPEVYNPCGIATGGIGYYKINVEPTSLFPDDKISWSVVSGDVSFVGNRNTGRLVAVKGGSTEGAFKLEVELEGVNFPANPCIAGMVLDPKTVPVTVWIVRDDNGNNAACSEGRVQELLSGVNAIFKQCAMTFHVNGAIQYTNCEEWLDIDFTNGWSGELESIRNIETATGGIELYFVRDFYIDGTIAGSLLGLEDTQGIVLRSGISERTLAHEIGHACGLLDIYPYRSVSNTLERVVTGPVTADRLPQDWGAGYYPPDLLQAYLITYRLLMMGYEDPTITTTCDIPLGSVYGTWFDRLPPLFEGDVVIDVWEQSLAPVGLNSMGNRQPCHQ